VSENVLVVELREGAGKGAARSLRRAGRAPAVVYGKGREPVPLSFDPAELLRLLAKSEAGLNTLIDLRAEGAKFAERTILVKELQRDPIRGKVLHADFYEIDLTRTVQVEVPIHLVGTPVGVSLSGGILDHNLRELEIECLPRAIPDSIDVDVSALEIGGSLHVRDIALPEGVTLISDLDLSVVSVIAPSAEEIAPPVVAAAGEAAAAAEGAPAETAAAKPGGGGE